MNRHQQEAKKYLSQAFGLNQRIESKLGQIEDLHDLATKATVTYSDMPRNPNKGHSRLEDAVIQIIELETEIRDIIALLEQGLREDFEEVAEQAWEDLNLMRKAERIFRAYENLTERSRNLNPDGPETRL